MDTQESTPDSAAPRAHGVIVKRLSFVGILLFLAKGLLWLGFFGGGIWFHAHRI